METYKNCQSCGMPMRADPEHGGTEADGSKSGMYCSLCYRNGEFFFKGNAQEMQAFCKKILRDKGYGRFSAWFMTAGIPRLKRWSH